jgi:hypothetical protein
MKLLRLLNFYGICHGSNELNAAEQTKQLLLAGLMQKPCPVQALS